MVNATDLKPGSAVRIEGQVYKVLEVDTKAGAAKMGGVVKVKLSNVVSGRLWEPHFRPQERLDDLPLERRNMEFLYSDDDGCTFMDPTTFEQVQVPATLVGPAEKFLQPGMQLPIEFFESQPISIVFPEIVEVKVSDTAPAAHAQQDSTLKEATLENGLVIRVPLFIAPGETVRVDVRTLRYLERAKSARK
ncbi:MAG TPA: elongation factor P [Terriglobales bacterium]|nr:elongation factor P [Terriglobales bacterium]